VEEIEDFKRRKALKQIRELVERVNLCMFCTRLGHVPFESRPMITVKVDEDCRLWFFSHASSHKNDEIGHDDRVELLYEDLKNSEFMAIHGVAEILIDSQKAAELWTVDAETWFPNGPEDPNLTIIMVTPIFSHYWHAKQSRMIALQTKEDAKPIGTTGPDEAVSVAA